MGAYFTALILDVLRGWIGSSDGGPLAKMTEDDIRLYQAMEERHESERQRFMRAVWMRDNG